RPHRSSWLTSPAIVPPHPARSASVMTSCPFRLRGILDEATERLALRAALSASHLLGLATGTHLRKLRAQNDPLAEIQARLEEAELRARLAPPPPESGGPVRVPRPVVARFVHHVWMMDISHVKQFLGPSAIPNT